MPWYSPMGAGKSKAPEISNAQRAKKSQKSCSQSGGTENFLCEPHANPSQLNHQGNPGESKEPSYWMAGDQAGSEALPGVCTRRSLRPKTSMEKIWAAAPPCPSRVYISTRPLGAQVGPSS